MVLRASLKRALRGPHWRCANGVPYRFRRAGDRKVLIRVSASCESGLGAIFSSGDGAVVGLGAARLSERTS